jgi:hypothetical protein
VSIADRHGVLRVAGVRTLRPEASHGQRVVTTNPKPNAENDAPHSARETGNRRFRFACKVVQDRGVVADSDVEQIRRAGYTDGEVGEIVANVALNIFTNYFNHVAATELDFPAAPDLAA